jgi:hypothetical protein
MGYSLGSVPSIHISSLKNIKCLILIAPLASGIKTIMNLNITINELEKIDIFCNLSKIIDITSPIMLIHGKSDEIININHSYEMLKKIKNSTFWFPSNGNHGNIFTRYRKKLIEKLNFFFDRVKIFHSHNKYDELVDNLDIYHEKHSNKKKESDKIKSPHNPKPIEIINMNLKGYFNRQENDLICIDENNRNTLGYDENVVKNMRKSATLIQGNI